MKASKIFSVILLICCIAILAIALSACSGEDVSTEISSVSIKNDKQNVELKATLDSVYVENHSSDKLYVLALTTSDTSSIPSNTEVLGEVNVKGNITFTFSLTDESGLSRLQKCFVLAEKSGASYAALTNSMYIQNPDILSSKQSSVPTVADIKGLATNDAYEAELTGADHVLFEVNMADIILDEYREGAIKYNRDGISYFFDGDIVARLDSNVMSANKLGARVYLKTINTFVPDAQSSDLSFDYFPNMTYASASRRIDAFYAFLAERYSGEYGQVSDYIIGRNANKILPLQSESTTLDNESYENLYFSWARTAHIALTSVNSGARVYIPVSNAWRSTSSTVIGAKAFLSRFAENAKSSGDYNWAIALDLGFGDDLSALLSSDSYDYSNIGVDNMSEISDLIDLASMRYGSEKRDFIIDSLALPTTISESNRAAYYICAYYKAAEVGAKAFIYSSNRSYSSLLDKNSDRNALYYMFILCGTNKTGQLTDYTKKVDGFTNERFQQNVFKKLTYLQSANYEIPESTSKNSAAFPVKLDGFAENEVTIAHMSLQNNSNGTLERVLDISAATDDRIGAVSAFDVNAKDIKAAHYIGITASSENRPTLFLSISNGSSENSVVYIAQTELVNAESEYYFDISELAKNIDESDKLSISICIASEDETSDISISNIALYGSSGFGSTTVIIIIAVILAALVLVALIVLLAVKRKKKAQRTREDS